jgi:hypothetical protein
MYLALTLLCVTHEAIACDVLQGKELKRILYVPGKIRIRIAACHT